MIVLLKLLKLLKLWKLALGLLVGLLIGWFFMTPIAREAGRAAGYETGKAAGITEERAAWTEEQNRARAKLDADRQAAEAKIADAERAYHARDQAHQADMNELEAALAAERDNATPIPTPSPGAACACRPAISRGVRDRLQAIGRGGAAPRSSPAGSQAPLR